MKQSLIFLPEMLLHCKIKYISLDSMVMCNKQKYNGFTESINFYTNILYSLQKLNFHENNDSSSL